MWELGAWDWRSGSYSGWYLASPRREVGNGRPLAEPRTVTTTLWLPHTGPGLESSCLACAHLSSPSTGGFQNWRLEARGGWMGCF